MQRTLTEILSMLTLVAESILHTGSLKATQVGSCGSHMMWVAVHSFTVLFSYQADVTIDKGAKYNDLGENASRTLPQAREQEIGCHALETGMGTSLHPLRNML